MKYDPLTKHIAKLTGDEWRAQFSDIEKVLGFKLPASARRYPAWWENNSQSHTHASAWLKNGWKTAEVDIAAERLIFRRKRPTKSNDDLRAVLQDVLDEMTAYAKVLNGESPVAAAVLAVAGLEDALEDIIKKRFKLEALSEELDRKLFGGGPTPFGTFDAKADVVQALGCYGKETRKQLKSIQAIRNNFAHAGRIIDFQHEKIWPKCESLKLGAVGPNGTKPPTKELQNKFTDLVLDLTQKLRDSQGLSSRIGREL